MSAWIDARVSIPSARRDRARRQGCVRVQQRFGVVEGRVRRDAAIEGDRRRLLCRSPAAIHLKLHSDPASFADMRWVYPRLPSEWAWQAGSRARPGAARCRTTVHEHRHPLDKARATGDFGITLGDTITIHDTELALHRRRDAHARAADPRFQVAASRCVLRARGGDRWRHAMAVNGDVTFDDARAGRSRVIAAGHVAFPGRCGAGDAICACKCCRYSVDMARTWIPRCRSAVK